LRPPEVPRVCALLRGGSSSRQAGDPVSRNRAPGPDAKPAGDPHFKDLLASHAAGNGASGIDRNVMRMQTAPPDLPMPLFARWHQSNPFTPNSEVQSETVRPTGVASFR